MQIVYKLGCYIATVADMHEATLLRDAGWKFSRDAWRTSKPAHVIPFADTCIGEAAKRIEAHAKARHADIAASTALDADIEIPAPEGLEYRPYQKAGIAYALQRDKVLIGDSMRLGKTMQAIGIANASKVKSHLIITPATPKINWKREYTKWDTNYLTIGVADGPFLPDTDVVIINYDIVTRHETALRKRQWDQLTIDEAHYLKGERSQRTLAILGETSPSKKSKGPIPAKRTVFLTGTPIFTRPKDLWTICRICDPNGLGKNRWAFVKRYCAADYDAAGKWDENGASNLEELQFLMRKRFMVRREKTDVAKEIPPFRSTVVLPKEGLETLVDAERSFVSQNLEKLDAMIRLGAQLSDVAAEHDEEHPQPYDDEVLPLSSARRELALRKLPMILPQLDELVEAEGKIVVFAHHRDVLTSAKTYFGDAAVLVMGGISAAKKQAAVDAFTNDPNVKIFLGNITAAGQAINLAAANMVVFLELSWVPSEMDQAEERVWLVDKETPIQVIRYVVEDSIDEVMVHVLDARQENIRKATHVKRLGVKALVN